MERNAKWFLVVTGIALMLFLGASISVSSAQSSGGQGTPAVTAEQQKQLDQLKQLEDQLQKDRDAVHNAINQYGWDSDQTDTARNQLIRDRTEYRKLRRSLVSAGVSVPAPSGFGAGRWDSGPGPMRGPMQHRGRGGYNCAGCNCPCCD